MTPESKVKKQVKEFLDSLGKDCWYYCPVPMGYGRKGIPDFIGCYKGQFFAIETKAQKKKTLPWQERECRSIRAAKGYAERLVYLPQFEMWINWVNKNAL